MKMAMYMMLARGESLGPVVGRERFDREAPETEMAKDERVREPAGVR